MAAEFPTVDLDYTYTSTREQAAATRACHAYPDAATTMAMLGLDHAPPNPTSTQRREARRTPRRRRTG